MNGPGHFCDWNDAPSRNATPSLSESPGAILWLDDTTTRAPLTGGDGEILYQGTKHTFTILGLFTADTVAPRIVATGIAKRLRTLLDFAGHYSAQTVESRLIAGDSVAFLRNERGVWIQLVAKHAGLRFGVAANGVHIKFKHSF